MSMETESDSITYHGRGWKGFGASILLIMLLSGAYYLLVNKEPIAAYLGLFFIPFGFFGIIYCIIKKKVVVSRDGIEYYIGNWKRFEASWNDVTSILSGLELKHSESVYIQIKTEKKKLSLDDASHFRKKKLRKIYDHIYEIQKEYPHIHVFDELDLKTLSDDEIGKDNMKKLNLYKGLGPLCYGLSFVIVMIYFMNFNEYHQYWYIVAVSMFALWILGLYFLLSCIELRRG